MYWIFSTIHTSNGVHARRSLLPQIFINFFKIFNKNVCLLSDWPAQSQDLNIIENMWALLKKNIRKHHLILKDDLWQVVQEEWYAIPNEYITSLYESLPRRLHEVLRNKGLNTKY